MNRYFLNGYQSSFFNWSMSIYSNYILFIFNSLCVLVSTCYNYYMLFLHTLEKKCIMGVPLHFFKCLKSASSLPKILISSTHPRFIVENDLMQQKRTLLALHFFKKVLPRIFFKFSVTGVLWILGRISSKVNKGIVRSRRPVVFYKKVF